ncbi:MULTISPECIES: methyltransferase domain-containing protein [Cyanophyceae]|uniref:class I SAM-dependent methyltransferase n=1 Tax=Cyanophyceae TaxID=3028117 RepID=UPI001689CCBF|nr:MULTISPECIES: methyltransferase domain-containing protein [Cyanophyceae]MBD1918807.1 methyltransferase domain-containing protein [Phormidium sp. FACHB-77]MBD2033350.1 methyltransferase domain-containing protein [Phormidium sp. FACHB-322]MBD2053717.1 methyltransferase domain-containing protein [Leptolyngbya sp. FACHB-60]
MGINSFRPFLARQLGDPSGWFGWLLLKFLNRRNAALNDLVLETLELQPGDRILEIGFGGGDLMHKLVVTGKPSQMVGVERSPDAIQICERRFQPLINQGTVELHQASAEALPFADQQFSQVCTVNTLYFWVNAPQVLSECRRVLKPGGRLVLGYASKDYLEDQGLTQHGFTAYEVAEVEALLTTAEFTAVGTVASQADSPNSVFCTSGVAAL